jgi:hypothetical protein
VGDDRLFQTRWVHMFEEDTADGAVYRPDTGDLPLSRRPRERVEFAADGTAKVITPGPDDRLVERPATWSSASRETASSGPKSAAAPDAAPAASKADFRIVKASADRVIVRRG